jgi:hypothetical protein
MNDRTDPAAPDRLAADPAGSSSQPAAATAMTVADAIEVAQTCTLAGRTDLIAGFLEAKASPAKVRSQLLAQRRPKPVPKSSAASLPMLLRHEQPAARCREAARGQVRITEEGDLRCPPCFLNR